MEYKELLQNIIDGKQVYGVDRHDKTMIVAIDVEDIMEINRQIGIINTKTGKHYNIEDLAIDDDTAKVAAIDKLDKEAAAYQAKIAEQKKLLGETK